MKWLGHDFWYGDFAGFIGISVSVIGKKVGGICVFGPWLKEYTSQIDIIFQPLLFKKSSRTALVLPHLSLRRRQRITASGKPW